MFHALFALILSAHAQTDCETQAKAVVQAVERVSFNAPKRFAPVVRSVQHLSNGEVHYLIDMETKTGEIMNGSHGGSSAYQVQMDEMSGCFVNSIQYADEP